jgi:hypothetical protein
MKLTKQSEELLSFFMKNSCITHLHPTKKVNNIFLKLYNEIKEAFVETSKHLKSNKNYVSIKKVRKQSEIKKPSSTFGQFGIPKNVLEHIEKFTSNILTFHFIFCGRNISIYFLVEEQNVEINMKYYNECVQNILMWLYIINKIGSQSCASNKLEIFLYMTSLKKELPKSENIILEQTHVNTAYTTVCPKDSEIIIYRKEEWFKVFIHESFHNFALDFSGMDTKEVHENILNLFQVNSEVNLFESYTEFWAEIINAIFCSFLLIHDKNDVNGFLKNVEYFVNMEINFSFFQMVKALNHMGLKYEDIVGKKNEKYKENTNVLAYYVIKTILLSNYTNFILWCERRNEKILNFKKTIKSQMEFAKFIKENSFDQKFLKSVKCTEEFFSSLKGNNYKILESMKMTICELG